LAQARWPEAAEVPADPMAAAEMEPVLETVRLLRNLRSEEDVAADASPRGFVRPSTPDARAILSAQSATVARLAHLTELTVLEAGTGAPAGAASRVAEFGECYLERPRAGPARSEALERERSRLAELLAKARARLADDGFLRGAPPEVVEAQRKREAELADRLDKIDRHLQGASP